MLLLAEFYVFHPVFENSFFKGRSFLLPFFLLFKNNTIKNDVQENIDCVRVLSDSKCQYFPLLQWFNSEESSFGKGFVSL